jgi:hypothetical protein
MCHCTGQCLEINLMNLDQLTKFISTEIIQLAAHISQIVFKLLIE